MTNIRKVFWDAVEKHFDLNESQSVVIEPEDLEQTISFEDYDAAIAMLAEASSLIFSLARKVAQGRPGGTHALIHRLRILSETNPTPRLVEWKR